MFPPPQAFLHIVPAPGEACRFSLKQQFHLHPVVGSSGGGFSLVKGLLVEQQDSPLGHSSCPEQFVVRRNERGKIVTALFDISMAGDPSDGLWSCTPCDMCDPFIVQTGYPDGLHLESDAPMGFMNVEDVMVRRILEMLHPLVHQGVGFVGCQKCMHRRVRDYLDTQVSGGVGCTCRINTGCILKRLGCCGGG